MNIRKNSKNKLDIPPQYLGEQILCSTAQNVIGKRLTIEDLNSIKNSMPNEFPIYEEHDISLPIIGFAKNPKIKNSSGIFFIVADIYYYDPINIQKLRCLSISYFQPNTNIRRDYDWEIKYDDRFYHPSIINDSILLSPEVKIKKTITHRNAFPIEGMIVITIATGFIKILSGTIANKISDSIVTFLINLLKNKKKQSAPQFTNIILTGEEKIKGINCMFTYKINKLEHFKEDEIESNFKKLHEEFLKIINIYDQVPSKISLEIRKNDVGAQLVYLQKQNGTLIKKV